MVTLKAKQTTRTDRRSRSGVCTLLLIVLALSSVLCSVAAEPALRQEGAGVVTEATHPVEKLGIEMESGRPQPRPVQRSLRRSSSGRDRSRTRAALEANVDENGLECETPPLYSRRVDPTNYEYGCREIEEMLDGNRAIAGKGGMRTVILVKYGGRKLAVKTLNDMKRLGQHNREVLTLDALRGHENVVGMLGLCGTTVVTDFITNSFNNVIFRDGEKLSTQRLVTLATDVAKGLQALHDIGGIHMDMNPNQLLISETGRGVVNDFNSVLFMGVSPVDQHAFCPHTIRKPQSTHNPWRSVDNLAGKPVTEKEDIYSLGMVFYSLMAGRAPYDSAVSLQRAQETNARPEIDAQWHQGFMEIVKDMWSERPQDRPSAREIVVRLEELDYLGDPDDQ